MQVFREAIEKNGGPLPLTYYLQDDAGSTPDAGPASLHSTIDLLHTRVDRRSFFECLLHDQNFAILTTFLVSGVPVNATRDEDGATALHVAAAGTLTMLNEDTIFRDVVGEHAGKRNGAVRTAAAASAEERNGRETEEELARSPSSLFTRRQQQSTQQILDPPCANQLILSFLMDNGADVNEPMRNDQGQTPLMVAAACQNSKVMKLLLAKGADVQAQDALGRTALTYAARFPHLLEVLRVWMGDETFLHRAISERLLHTVCRSPGNAFAALYLIEEVHLDVNMHDDPPASASSPATASNGTGAPPQRPAKPVDLDEAAVPVLRSATITTAGNAYATRHAFPPLPGATAAANTESAAAEMPRTLAHSGDTPLHCAVSIADVVLVRALLRQNADVLAEDHSGLTPLQLAQSVKGVKPSMKQYWKDELVRWLRPNSAAAQAARRRRQREGGHGTEERNPLKVRALLIAYNNATPGPSREKLVQEETPQYVWELCTPMDFAEFVATALLPHLFFYLCCHVLRNFFLLLCVVPFLYASYIGMQKRDRLRPNSRPLAGAGWCLGFVMMQGLCLPLLTTWYYFQYYSFDLESHAAITWWLIPSATVTVLSSFYFVLFSSPGVLTSTEGQRKGIYASLRNAKGTYAKELLYGIDLRTMVRKPLRAQFCRQLQRVVLRYDHFCTYLSTPVGGGNHRLFVGVHLSLLVVLCCFYYYAREHARVMSRMAAVARSDAPGFFASQNPSATTVAGVAGQTLAHGMNMDVLQEVAATPFTTAESRFGYMYTQVILPIMIGMVLYTLYHQACLIARNLTSYDLGHADDESSTYCFILGSTIYSLYDRGIWANLAEFCSWTSFTQATYRVPQMNPHLQKVVEDHQRWQLTTSSGGDGPRCDGHHAHGQANAGHTHNSTNTLTVTTGERIGPAEFGDDESKRTQEMLAAKRRQAELAATTATTAVANEAQKSHPNTIAAAAVEVEGEAVVHGTEDAYDEEEEDTEAPPSPSSLLAMQIFQQMVRTGSTDVGRGTENGYKAGASSAADGADAETQQAWDAAVLQARQMFEFYRQSLGAQGEDNS